MTDNEIIKALQEWAERGMTFCNVGMPEFARNILGLINRQKAEIDDLVRNDLPRCKDALRRANEIGMGLDKENQELKAEIEKLKADVKRLTTENENLTTAMEEQK